MCCYKNSGVGKGISGVGKQILIPMSMEIQIFTTTSLLFKNVYAPCTNGEVGKWIEIKNCGGGKGICGEGKHERAPHNHGDMNIHSVYMLLEEHMHHVAMKQTTGS